jgi:rhamnogalacturonyl hydrolase YesR
MLMLFAVSSAAEDTNALALAAKVADRQLALLAEEGRPGAEALPPGGSRGWERAAFWTGLTHFADAGGDPAYREAILAQGRANGWRLGDWLEFADDHAIGQSYLWAAQHGAGDEALAPMRKNFDALLADPPVVHLSFWFGEDGYGKTECLVRWCWSDALFMSPPAMIGLSLATGDERYARYAFDEFRATTDFLFDPAEKLYFRDSRFFGQRDDAGRKLFWSRGNGWVFAGIANILRQLPETHPERAYFEALFVAMAERLRELQKPDGYWPPSLLAPANSPPETSGTGFFTYGFAWGVNQGLLDRERFLEPARRGWLALRRAVGDDGRLGWVQQISDRPDDVAPTDTQFYGVGAFLLAASEIPELLSE